MHVKLGGIPMKLFNGLAWNVRRFLEIIDKSIFTICQKGGKELLYTQLWSPAVLLLQPNR